jgi:hypothetical protein
LNKLDYLDAPLTAFVLRNERLMPTKVFCQILLREIRVLSGRNQEVQ